MKTVINIPFFKSLVKTFHETSLHSLKISKTLMEKSLPILVVVIQGELYYLKTRQLLTKKDT